MIRALLAGLVLLAAVAVAGELLRPRVLVLDGVDGPPLPPVLEPEVAAAIGRKVQP